MVLSSLSEMDMRMEDVEEKLDTFSQFGWEMYVSSGSQSHFDIHCTFIFLLYKRK